MFGMIWVEECGGHFGRHLNNWELGFFLEASREASE